MEQELEYLGRAIANPGHPYIAILGGAKISDKILVVETLLSKCDKLIIGGGMANPFLAAKGLNMQDSLVEEASLETAKSILAKSADKLILPVDASPCVAHKLVHSAGDGTGTAGREVHQRLPAVLLASLHGHR